MIFKKKTMFVQEIPISYPEDDLSKYELHAYPGVLFKLY